MEKEDAKRTFLLKEENRMAMDGYDVSEMIMSQSASSHAFDAGWEAARAYYE